MTLWEEQETCYGYLLLLFRVLLRYCWDLLPTRVWMKDLVFYLTFDNVKDQTIIDESGNGLDAEILERVDIVKGKYGDAIRLKGQSGGLRQYPCSREIESYR